MSRRTKYLLYALVGALGVYVFSQWPALTNPYVVMDDVRQQTYWMQKWRDPELFQNDLLSEYAQNYVSWGVQAIYALATPFIDPLQFGKILSGILYLVTAGFLFGLGMRFRDDLTPVFVVCVFCFFGDFMERIAGGIPQSFGYPLLAAYLYFLSGNNLVGAGVALLLASVFIPYVFMLCLVTHGLYLIHNYWRTDCADLSQTGTAVRIKSWRFRDATADRIFVYSGKCGGQHFTRGRRMRLDGAEIHIFQSRPSLATW